MKNCYTLESVPSITTENKYSDSIETVTAEQLASISRSPSTIFLNFAIRTHQPPAAYAQFLEKKAYLVSDFSPVSIPVKTLDDLPDVIPQPKKEGCGSSAAIAQVMLVLSAALVIKRKKK